jgi:hypothetical protein
MEAATGEIIAYTDDDTRADPQWLSYLAVVFMRTDHAGVGGPNIAPPGDGFVADAVTNAPGGPIHVLLSDREAEHIPGCNMAFRKVCLRELGGFDPQFRAAGDDVDVCWRLQARGWTLGFCPAAMVWHHRRTSVRLNLVRIPFCQYDHGRALQGCRDTGFGNLGSIPYPSFRDLFGSGSAGLGERNSLPLCGGKGRRDGRGRGSM